MLNQHGVSGDQKCSDWNRFLQHLEHELLPLTPAQESFEALFWLPNYIVIHWLYTLKNISKADAESKILGTILLYFSVYASFFALQEKVQVSSDNWSKWMVIWKAEWKNGHKVSNSVQEAALISLATCTLASSA